MKNMLRTLMLSFLFSSGVFADFEAGLDAYEQGDYATALKVFKKLAKQGDAAGQVGLGLMYNDGKGVTRDYQAAATWFRLAADQGDVFSQDVIGHIHRAGKGVTRDYQAAAKWFRLAAVQGYAPAQYNLGVMYQKGLGVTFNPVISLMWIHIAAINKDEKAIGTLSYIISEMASIKTGKNIAHANRLAHQCIKKNYKDCG